MAGGELEPNRPVRRDLGPKDAGGRLLLEPLSCVPFRDAGSLGELG